MSIRTHLQTLQHRAVASGLSIGALSSTPRLQLGGASAQFRADGWREWLRAHDALGESRQLRWLLAHVHEDDVVLDVGAAVGTYCCLAADVADRVVAVEPHPEAAERLRENIRLNEQADRVTVHECALGADGGQARLESAGGAANGSHRLGAGSIKVAVRRGDDLGVEPDVVKIDVEGHERAALAGLAASLEHVRVALVEVHDGVDEAAVRGALSAAGLAVERVGDRGGETHLGGVAAIADEAE